MFNTFKNKKQLYKAKLNINNTILLKTHSMKIKVHTIISFTVIINNIINNDINITQNLRVGI
jgi:hypothetical protein